MNACCRDSSAPISANRVEGILMHICRWYMMEDMGMSDDPSTWLDTLLAQDWAQADVTRAWIEDRAAHFGSPTCTEWASLSHADGTDVLEQFWNLVPCCVGSFFDDGFWAAGPELAESMQRAVMRLSTEVKVEGQIEKFERATLDGHHYGMNADGTWFELFQDDGSPSLIEILGKQFNLANGTRGDSEQRLRGAEALLDEILRMAKASPRKLVYTSILERLRGQYNFITQTSKSLRSLLFGLTKSIKAQAQVWRRQDKRRRAFHLGRAAHQAACGEADAWDWTSFRVGGAVSLASECFKELPELKRAAREFNTEAWLPKRAAPPADQMVWIFNDSAGLSASDEHDYRAGACWMWSPRWDHCKFIQERLSLRALRGHNSTQLETGNGVANADWVADNCPWCSCIVEVYDNQATTYNLKSMTCKAEGLTAPLKQRRECARRHPKLRFLTLFNKRELGTVADLLSKDDIARASAAVLARFPSHPLAARPVKRPRNCYNL